MASNRHLGRVIVLQSLYEYELRTLAHDPEVDLDTIVAKNIEPFDFFDVINEITFNDIKSRFENLFTEDKAVLSVVIPKEE